MYNFVLCYMTNVAIPYNIYPLHNIIFDILSDSGGLLDDWSCMLCGIIPLIGLDVILGPV